MGRSLKATAPGRRLSLDVEAGRLELVWYGSGAPPEELLAAGLAREGLRDGGSRVTFKGGEAWVKGGRLKAKSALRHLARQRLLGRPFPRLAEAANLAWLRAHGIAAARPLLAGLLLPGGSMPTLQFLATEFIPEVLPLDALRALNPVRYAGARSAARQLLEEMHAAGFSHRDAFERNFLITCADDAIAIDTWRGGPKRRLTRAARERDLADFEGAA